MLVNAGRARSSVENIVAGRYIVFVAYAVEMFDEASGNQRLFLNAGYKDFTH
jgi:hypothetical protein